MQVSFYLSDAPQFLYTYKADDTEKPLMPTLFRIFREICVLKILINTILINSIFCGTENGLGWYNCTINKSFFHLMRTRSFHPSSCLFMPI